MTAGMLLRPKLSCDQLRKAADTRLDWDSSILQGMLYMMTSSPDCTSQRHMRRLRHHRCTCNQLDILGSQPYQVEERRSLLGKKSDF